MKIFTLNDVLRVAKRFNNKKRNYLLVNPLQGKHLPVSPISALEMMNELGKKVEKIFSARLVIGFAETATAIGAIVAKNFSENCFYLQTTRENLPNSSFIEFLEEHSHAPEQKLLAGNFSELLKQTDGVVFVDDEISTGKTLLNVIRQLKSKFPALNDKKICVASIINRLSEENLAKLAAENIFCVYLVKINEIFDVEKFSIEPTQEILPLKKNFSFHEINFTSDPRFGVKIGEYINQCEISADFIAEMLKNEKDSGEILILGTEEFMLPAIIAGRRLERENFLVFTHSTTRSPIGVSNDENYPIREGFKLKSFYDSARTTFIYNLKHYDAAIIMTNAENFTVGAEYLISALNFYGIDKIFIVRCGNV